MDAEIVIRGGTVIDGTGAPGDVADVGVSNGRIVAIGRRLHGRLELDASGCVVSPGFIDIHTHYDAQVFWDPRLTPSSFHGVTTVVAGNCGFSIAPVHGEQVPLLVRTLQNVEDMDFDTLSVGVPWDEFETFPQYLDTVARRGVGLNFACYVGHTAVRVYVMGDEAYERRATEDELRRMQALIGEAMLAGAIGFASSASPTHNGDRGRPVPSRVADLDELRALIAPVSAAGRGVIGLLPGGVIPMADVFRLQQEAARPVTWAGILPTKGFGDHEEVMAAHDAARRDGIDVWPQVTCRPLVLQMNMLKPFTLNTRQSFAALIDCALAERLAAYRDPAWRRMAWEDLSAPGPGGRVFDWSSISVAESASRPDLVERSVVELANEWRCTPLDVIIDISLRDELQTRFWSVLANDDPDGIAWLLPQDNVLFGLADSGAHVSQLCDACFATDLLGKWVREREVMSLEAAIQKLTSQPAGVFGLTDRGSVLVGKIADLCVFDPRTVAPGPLRRVCDFPANGERLTADQPVGIRHVLVNGEPIRRDGEPVERGGALPGVVLRG